MKMRRFEIRMRRFEIRMRRVEIRMRRVEIRMRRVEVVKIKQDIRINVPYSRPNGWTELAEIFCGHSWVSWR